MTTNFANRTLYHGDNLDFLRGMNSQTVHLIATDPPFNKNKDFHATPDSLASGASFQDRWSWRDDVHDEWLIEIQRDQPEVWSIVKTTKDVYGDDMGAYLAFMSVRLLEMHRVLKDDGSLYLHCDTTASHYIKALLDAVFGPRNYRSEITWKRTSAHNDTKQGRHQHGRVHDVLFFYTKSEEWTWNPIYTEYDPEYINNFYKYTEPETSRRYRLGDLTGPGGASKGNPHYELMGVTRYWRHSLERMNQLMAEGRIIQTKPGAVPQYKRYLDEMQGVPLQDLWTDIKPLQSQAKERTGYPTQKPLTLYERLILSSSNPGDIVLDPFCGCASTPVAAEHLGRQWIRIDIWDDAYQTVLNRMAKEGLIVEHSEAQPGQQTLTVANIHYETNPPKRTDHGEPAVLQLQTPTGKRAMRFPPPRSQQGRLLLDVGSYCQGCGRDYSFDTRVLEVDHIRPKSDGGSDAYDNLTLLCPPCNKEKRDRMTLTGLQDFNRKTGHLLPENEKNIRHGRGPRTTPQRRTRRR